MVPDGHWKAQRSRAIFRRNLRRLHFTNIQMPLGRDLCPLVAALPHLVDLQIDQVFSPDGDAPEPDPTDAELLAYGPAPPLRRLKTPFEIRTSTEAIHTLCRWMTLTTPAEAGVLEEVHIMDGSHENNMLDRCGHQSLKTLFLNCASLS